MKNSIIRLNLLCWACALSIGATAQGPKYRSAIEPVDSTGFYRILLHHGSVGNMKSNMADLRIFDSKNQAVPYMPAPEQGQQTAMNFQEFPILSHEIIRDSATIVVIPNKDRKRINNLSLIVGNARVEKQIRLTGSNDRKVWFSVRENAVFSSVNNPDDVAEIKLIDFPLSDYAFFRIEIDDRHNSPVNVVKVGMYAGETISQPVGYTPIKSTFSTIDSAKQKVTWVDVSFNQLMVVDKMQVEVGAPAFYQRNVAVYVFGCDSAKDVKRHFVMDAVFASDQPIVLYPNNIYGRGLTLAIENKDNAPLTIQSIRTWQKNRYCIAWLDKGETYQLRFGDASLNEPDYDIRFFKEQLKGNLPELKADESEPIPESVSPKKKHTVSFFRDERFIWAAIMIVIALLGWMTYAMMKDKIH